MNAEYITIDLYEFKQKYKHYSRIAKCIWLVMNGFSHYLSEKELEETNNLCALDSYDELLESMTLHDREYCKEIMNLHRKQIDRWRFK